VKKVRLAMGAVGMPAAIAMGIPAVANATTEASHHFPQPGKSVALGHRDSPLVTCGVNNLKQNGNGTFSLVVEYSGFCVHRQSAILFKRQTGLTERVRYYSGGGYLEFTEYLGGHLGSASTAWHSSPNTTAAQVCAAVVPNSNHDKVKYGPVCVKI
jgi:hypothetical protein